MKIWIERQTNCRGQFVSVNPTGVFQSNDCLRMRFRLNFEGFLTIINLGTSGKNEVIFPSDGQSNQIFPKTENFLPDNKGWQFDDTAGNEQIIFIVSKSAIDQSFIDGYVNKRDIVMTDSADLEVYDRDIKPRTENDSVYILSNETRLEKPLVFRMTLKHR